MDTPREVTDISPATRLNAVGHAVLIVFDEGEHNRAELVARSAGLVDDFRAKGQPVVFVRDPRTRPLAGLEPRAEEYLVRRHRFSAFFGTDLDIVLRGYQAQTIVLIGGTTDVGIHYTAADAHQLDYRVRVVPETCAGSSPAAHEAAQRSLKYLQRDALVTPGAVRDWLSTAPAPAPSPAAALA